MRVRVECGMWNVESGKCVIKVIIINRYRIVNIMSQEHRQIDTNNFNNIESLEHYGTGAEINSDKINTGIKSTRG